MNVTSINIDLQQPINENAHKQPITEKPTTALMAFYDSVCGTTHPNNEDSVKIAPPFYGLADGVGGGAGGDIASSTLLNTCATANLENFNDSSIQELLYQADSDIKHALNSVSKQRGASTLVASWLNEQGQGVYTWVGDARIYRIDVISNKITTMVHLTQLTTDHTYGNVREHVPEGWDADDPAHMIGVGRRVVGNPECLSIELQTNQGLLLCSDGVHKFMPHDKMCQTLEELISLYGLETAITKYASQLVALSVDLGSYDDCSALVVYKADEQLKQNHQHHAETELDATTPVNNEQISTMNK